MQQPTQTPRLTPTRGLGQTVIATDCLKIHRLALAEGGYLPAHSSQDDVVIVVLRGSGVFHVDDEPRAVSAGDVLDVLPGQSHAIDATSGIEMIIVHVRRTPDAHRWAREMASHSHPH